MKIRAWSLLTAFACGMCATPNSQAAFSFLWMTPYQCDMPGLEGHTVYRIYADFTNLGDRLLTVFGNTASPMTINASGSFYQHPAGDALAPSNELISRIPLAEWDTFVTVGLARMPKGSDQTVTTPGFMQPPFNNLTNAAWQIPSLAADQGAPDITGRVLIAQLTLPPGSQIGTIKVNILYKPAGSSGQMQVNGVMPVLLPYQFADLDSNFVVNVDDLLMVINTWGQTGPGIADPSDDGVTNVDDLLAVINHWGSFQFPCLN